MIIGQLTRDACVSGQNTSCTRAVVLHFAEFTVTFFIWKRTTDVQFLSQILSQSWLIGNKTSCCPILSVIIRVINKLDSRFAVVRFCWQRRAQQKYGEKLGRERHPVVSQKWLSSHCIEPSTLYLSLNIITSVLLRSPSPLNFWFHRPRNYILWELYNKRKQRIVIDTASNL